MDYVTEVDPHDEVVEIEGARVMNRAHGADVFSSAPRIDYETGLLESGFKFRNPNVTDACGLPESSIKFEGVEDLEAERRHSRQVQH